MEFLPKTFLPDDELIITQLYTDDGKKAGRQIRHREHLIFVPDEAEPEPLPKTLLPTAALLLNVILVFLPRRKSPIVAPIKKR